MPSVTAKCVEGIAIASGVIISLVVAVLVFRWLFTRERRGGDGYEGVNEICVARLSISAQNKGDEGDVHDGGLLGGATRSGFIGE